MNLEDVRYNIRRFFERFSPEQVKRVKLIGASVLVAIALGWFVVRIVPVLMPAPRTKELNTEGWKLARELNDQLLQKPAFVDVGFDVVSESPVRLKVVGAVRSERELQELHAFVRQLRPDDQIEFNVEILE